MHIMKTVSTRIITRDLMVQYPVIGNKSDQWLVNPVTNTL
jgi:hypothetical protein